MTARMVSVGKGFVIDTGRCAASDRTGLHPPPAGYPPRRWGSTRTRGISSGLYSATVLVQESLDQMLADLGVVFLIRAVLDDVVG